MIGVVLASGKLDVADPAVELLEVCRSSEMSLRRLVHVPARPGREGLVARLAEVLVRAAPNAGPAGEHLEVVVIVVSHFGFRLNSSFCFCNLSNNLKKNVNKLANLYFKERLKSSFV